MRGRPRTQVRRNLRRVREEDTRGSVAGLNANEAVISLPYHTVGPGHVWPPERPQHRLRSRALQSHINFLLGRVGEVHRGLRPGGRQWTKNTSTSTIATPIRVLCAGTWKARPNLTIDLGLPLRDPLSPHTRRTTSLSRARQWSRARSQQHRQMVPGDCSKISSAHRTSLGFRVGSVQDG